MWSDLRYSIRSFLKTPALTSVILLTLALGIGANSAIFSVIDAVLLRPAPVKDIERLSMSGRRTAIPEQPASLHRSRIIRLHAAQPYVEGLAAMVATRST